MASASLPIWDGALPAYSSCPLRPTDELPLAVLSGRIALPARRGGPNNGPPPFIVHGNGEAQGVVATDLRPPLLQSVHLLVR